MSSGLPLIKTTVGKKFLMAVTGVILIGFIIGHLAGNLLVFQGPDALNAYAKFLRSHPKILWPVRIVMLLSVSVHIVAAVTLWLRNRAARPHSYEQFRPQETTIAARTMVYGGFAIALFIVYHLLHLTFGTVGPPFDPNDVYGNVVAGFNNKGIAAVYILAQVFLGLHLYHGAWSFLQTLGASHPVIDGIRKPIAAVFAVVIALGYISIPVAILAGVVK